MFQLPNGLYLYLARPLSRNTESFPDLTESQRLSPAEAEIEPYHFRFAAGQGGEGLLNIEG